MENSLHRRTFIKALSLFPAVSFGGLILTGKHARSQEQVRRTGGPRIKISLNAYSFNEYLRSGEMDLDDLLEFCARLNFDAVDPTGYYFPNYPDVPDDAYIYHIKRKAFLLGLGISGTGVRQDFTNPDPDRRAADVGHVKEWIEVASKLGAPVIRVFAGRGLPEGYTWEQASEWSVAALKECADYGKQHGVMVAIQNHDDFIKTAEQIEILLRRVNSEWLGLILDVGSFTQNEPYSEIAAAAPYAVSWQIKQYLGYDHRRVRTDLDEIVRILREVNYRGYIPLETLGGDPKQLIPPFLNEVRDALSS